MDEVKIYSPSLQQRKIEMAEASMRNFVIDRLNPKRAKKDSKWKSRLETMAEVFHDHADREKAMCFRHPWFNVMYNWLIVLLVVALFVSFVIWGLDVRTNRMAEALTATAMAEYQAELDAEEQARLQAIAAEKASEEAIIRREATEGAKAIYGIRNFVDKYGYSKEHLKTYIRCICDRVDYGGGVNSFESIVAEKAQFLGYSENSPVLDEYYKIAKEEIETWHHESTKPWDSSFRFAELKEDGIWLTNEFGANGYARRVSYGK